MLTYLASPYSDSNAEVVANRMTTFNNIDGQLLRAGKFTVSPLSKTFGLQASQLPSDWEYWQHYSRKLLAKCDEMYVIMSPGWETSEGVQGEIDFAHEHNIPVIYISDDGQIILEEYDDTEDSK